MLAFIAFLFLIAWVIAYFGFHIIGSFIHILLVIAVIMFLVRVIQGRNPVR